MDLAGKARADLIKRLSTPIKVTPEIGARLRGRLKSAAASGKSELEVMRFPVDLVHGPRPGGQQCRTGLA